MGKAKQEACELYIEQEIKKGIEQGKTPYSIGKEVAGWIQRLFEVNIQPRTIEQRARRVEDATNVANDLTPPNDSENESNQSPLDEIKAPRQHRATGEPMGGIREGAGRPPKFKVVEPAIASKWTGDQESYTPEKYIEAARAVMKSIDLDPASNEIAQKIIKAEVYFTKEEDGLNKEWNGNIFLNPPYSHPEIKYFIDKLLKELKPNQQAILLTNNNTDTNFFHAAAQKASCLCFTKGRINFLKPDGGISSPTNGQVFFYFGADTTQFIKYFSEFGILMKVI